MKNSQEDKEIFQNLKSLVEEIGGFGSLLNSTEFAKNALFLKNKRDPNITVLASIIRNLTDYVHNLEERIHILEEELGIDLEDEEEFVPMTERELNLFIFEWKEKYGIEVRSKHMNTTFKSVPVDSIARRQMYVILIDTLANKGYGLEDFTVYLSDKIVRASVPLDYSDKKALAKWKLSAENDLRIAIAEVYGDTQFQPTID